MSAKNTTYPDDKNIINIHRYKFDSEFAKNLYYYSVIEKETSILYTGLTKEEYFALEPTNKGYIVDYNREFKGVKIDIGRFFGGTRYGINFNFNGDIWHNTYTPPSYPKIADRFFGIDYDHLVIMQGFIKEEIEKKNIDVSDFIIEKDNDWPIYTFKKDINDLICFSKKLFDKNATFQKIEQVL